MNLCKSLLIFLFSSFLATSVLAQAQAQSSQTRVGAIAAENPGFNSYQVLQSFYLEATEPAALSDLAPSGNSRHQKCVLVFPEQAHLLELPMAGLERISKKSPPQGPLFPSVKVEKIFFGLCFQDTCTEDTALSFFDSIAMSTSSTDLISTMYANPNYPSAPFTIYMRRNDGMVAFKYEKLYPAKGYQPPSVFKRGFGYCWKERQR